MDDLPRSVKEELQKRDDHLLALEMLIVDQSSRLLALEAVVASMSPVGQVQVDEVKQRIAAGAERFRARFESISGFTERTQRIAEEWLTATQQPPSGSPNGQDRD